MSLCSRVGPRKLLTLLASLLVSANSVSAVDAAKTKSKAPTASVDWQPSRPMNGSPVVFRVTSPERLKSLSGKWLQHDVFFAPDSQGTVWYGIAGASLETHPGNYPLELKGETASGKEVSLTKPVKVGKAKYHSIQASVPKQYTEPSPEQLKKIDQDKALKARVLGQVTAGREWVGSFHAPAKAQISDVFGTARTFNGKVQSVH